MKLKPKLKFDNIADAFGQLEQLQSEHARMYLFYEVYEEQDSKGNTVCFRLGKPFDLAKRFNVDEENSILRPL